MTKIGGVWAASLTPQTADGAVDTVLFAAHGRHLFAHGVDGLTLFGTTGEGQSFSVAERQATLEAMLKAGIPPEKLMVGTGCAALSDVVTLTRHAIAAGVPRVLLLPPFFFKNVNDAGVFDAYQWVIDRVNDPRLRVLLYHIPSMTQVDISHATIDKLLTRYPGIVVGIKDSSGDWPHAKGLIDVFGKRMNVMVGAEPHLPAALRQGGTGTICGMVNLVPGLIRTLFDKARAPDIETHVARINALIAAIMEVPFISAMKTMLALDQAKPGWRHARPPFAALPAEAEAKLVARFAAAGITMGRAAAAE